MPKPAHEPFRASPDNPGLTPVATLVIWSLCLAIGIAGLCWHPDRVREPPAPKSLDALLLTVQASTPVDQVPSPLRPTIAAQAPPPPQAPEIPMPDPEAKMTIPSDESIQTASVPNPAPVIAPPPRRAAVAQPVVSQPAVIQLTFGQGEGAQPPPDYPPEAVIDGEEGTVVVRLDVDADGRVTGALASSPCRWPLLNQAAVRAVRDTWRFAPGAPRSYQVSIQFQLNRH